MHGKHDCRREMRVPVKLLRRSVTVVIRLKIVDLDRVHTTILKQFEPVACISSRLRRLRARIAQDVHICRAVVAVIGNRECRCRGGDEENAEECDQSTGEEPCPMQPLHRHPSQYTYLNLYYFDGNVRESLREKS